MNPVYIIWTFHQCISTFLASDHFVIFLFTVDSLISSSVFKREQHALSSFITRHFVGILCVAFVYLRS